MSDFKETLPEATPDNQDAPRARAGGTAAPNDFSRSAQRSKARKDGDDQPPDAPDPDEDPDPA